MNRLRTSTLRVVDFFMLPLVYPAAILLKGIRVAGVKYLPRCKVALQQVGVFPIRTHYYEPLFDTRAIESSLAENRMLPGIDWNVRQQLETLDDFQFHGELADISTSKVSESAFYLNNGAFESGDAEYWYNLIRLKKPNRIFEIGSGYSTLMAIKATTRNEETTPGYRCKHVCVEPYEMPWLERMGVSVIREKVEEVGTELFSELGENDILFIDSSHVIRPQGDVLFEYLQLLPTLKRGVIVHIHDIFSPKDYPEAWVKGDVRFWNEQYLLEAFLTCNSSWKIVGALNYLHHSYYERLKDKCPFLTPEREPGSFYIQKVI